MPSRIITPDEARELCPLLAGEDILAASYCPTDAHATPESVVQGYAFGARRHGAHLAVSTPVEGIDVVDGVIKGVRTPHGTVETGTVICAAGAWSRACGEMVGVELDVTPLRRQVLFTAPMARPAGQAAADDRLRHRLLLPPRGPRAADGHGRPERDAGLLHRDHRRLDPGAARDRRAPRAADRLGAASRAAGPASTT